MASTSYISGLASGLDWDTMITKLVAVERNPITLLENNKADISKEKSAWNDVNTKLQSLLTAVSSLSSLDDFNLFTPSATIRDTSSEVGDLLNFAAGSNASEGSYNITVNQLATAQKFSNDVNVKTFSSTSEPLGIPSGDVTINGRVLSISETDSLANIRHKINALNTGENPAGVTASLITVSSGDIRLTITSKTTGAAGISIVDDSGIFATQLGMTQITAGQDAEITIDGNTITRDTNQISDVISGVTLNLVGADENATITLNVNHDTDGVKKKIQDFVDSYNAMMTYIAGQNAVTAEGETSTPLFADSSLRSIQSTLRSAIQSGVSGLDSTLDHLSLIGMSLDRTGKLSIDDDTLDGYLESNFQDVVNLFAVHGSSTNSSLTYVASGTNTVGGDYEVEITQAATKASVAGSTFSGTLSAETTLILTSAGGTEQTITLSAGSGIDAIVDAINAGNTLGITAENDGGRLKLSNGAYGSSGNFTISGISGELGVADGTYTGVDVAGRIRVEGSSDWMTMTGRGQNLTGDDDQDVGGLVINYTGTSTGTFDFSFIEGVGAKLDEALSAMTRSIDGLVAAKQSSLQTMMDNIDKKISTMEDRLASYQEALSAKFTRMEALLSMLESQQSYLTSQIDALSSSSK
jgi:flagellar hook-associated protein 2